jgi:hypothetical protein
MPQPNRTVAPPEAWPRPDTIAVEQLDTPAVQQLQYALLRELVSLLEGAMEALEPLQNGGLKQYPQNVDARPHFDWIAQTVAALDACGWQDAIAQGEDRRVDPALTELADVMEDVARRES